MNHCACGCGELAKRGKRFLQGHWAKANRALIGEWKRLPTPKDHGDGYLCERVPLGPTRLQHVLVAERVLGRSLPPGAVVHHVDGNRSNNIPANLVICPDGPYHALIHRRERALAACGNADWRWCQYCKTYDAPERMAEQRRGSYSTFRHLKCAAEWQAARRKGLSP